MITIKKYGNRRLYDSSRSRYINLEELAAIVRNGDEIEIVDAKTGEDLTREVLLQVVLEVLKGADFFPTSMLRRIIRVSGDDPVQRLLRKQMTTGLELLHDQLDRVEKMLGATGAKAGWPGSWTQATNPFEAAGVPPEPEPEPEPEPSEDPAEELDALRARLAALEQRLEK
ncbi:MAG: hypothetical protein H6739_41080 [Alphaproteobacteria bacterium]|nr:hypothetical protein [Alphaproteobacteria bacterium]